MRVLLVEDDEDIADAILSRLRRRGCDLQHQADGAAGAEAALDETLDIIVLDVNLPGQSGFEIIRQMRAAGIKTPVLILTARSQIGDKISLFGLGADDYLVKPFDLRELEARIDALARRRLGEAQPVVAFGDLRLNLSHRSATLGGAPLELGKREFEVLATLVAAGARVVSKDSLVVRLFGFEDQGSSNAVELLVSRLRRKLSGSSVGIQTQRGVGYYLG
ncbi:response regulator transcription factor [Tropicimonas sp. IMCC34043]|uniref:response regulator transcription factor n=1 Tax=Tropicimonas sp. IMCC34043 TaxID=2248760 RepID=UPI000E226346|nr:response regulator transcription factor [Tropicimonas sp. IMCC34043]